MGRVTDYINQRLPTPKKQEVGIGDFTAFARVRDTTTMTAKAPATPVEDGSIVNDHIIIEPLTISIEGEVADVHLRRFPLARGKARVAAQIGNITGQYAPARTQTQVQKVAALATSALDALAALDTAVQNGEQVGALFGNQDTASKPLQSQFLDAMEKLHYGRQLAAIDMPFRHRESMVITSFITTTDNETDDITFTLEATRFNFAKLEFTRIARAAAGTGGQLEDTVSRGTQEGTPREQSLLSTAFGYLGF